MRPFPTESVTSEVLDPEAEFCCAIASGVNPAQSAAVAVKAMMNRVREKVNTTP